MTDPRRTCVKRLEPGELHGSVLAKREVSGFQLSLAEHAACSSLPKHAHENGYFCFPLTGSYTERCGSFEVACKPSSAAYRAAGTEHSAVLGDARCRVFVVEIPERWMARLDKGFLTVRATLDIQDGALPLLGRQLSREFLRTDAASALCIEGLTLQMLAEAARQASAPLRSVPAWLQRARELIHDEFHRTLTLDLIAFEVGVHPVHLATAYRKAYGLTIGEAVRRLRVEQACDELKGSLPLAMVALRAGYADQSHFTKAFKAYVGTTPARYRRAALYRKRVQEN